MQTLNPVSAFPILPDCEELRTRNHCNICYFYIGHFYSALYERRCKVTKKIVISVSPNSIFSFQDIGIDNS